MFYFFNYLGGKSSFSLGWGNNSPSQPGYGNRNNINILNYGTQQPNIPNYSNTFNNHNTPNNNINNNVQYNVNNNNENNPNYYCNNSTINYNQKFPQDIHDNQPQTQINQNINSFNIPNNGFQDNTLYKPSPVYQSTGRQVNRNKRLQNTFNNIFPERNIDNKKGNNYSNKNQYYNNYSNFSSNNSGINMENNTSRANLNNDPYSIYLNEMINKKNELCNNYINDNIIYSKNNINNNPTFDNYFNRRKNNNTLT